MRSVMVMMGALLVMGCATTDSDETTNASRAAEDAASSSFVGAVPADGNWLLTDVPDYTEDCGFQRVLGARMDALMLGEGNFSTADFLSYRIFSEEGADTFQIVNKAQGTSTTCIIDNTGAFTCDRIEAPYVSAFTEAFILETDWSGQLLEDGRLDALLVTELVCRGSECGFYSSAGFTFPCTLEAGMILE